MGNSIAEQWQRLNSVIDWSNMTINHFAIHIGLGRGEKLYQIKRGNYGISPKVAAAVVEAFPEINVEWLSWGVGEMFVAGEDESTYIDFYELDVEHDVFSLEQREPNSKMLLPRYVEADFAMVYRADAMGEVTPPNTIVMLKRYDTEILIPGYEYLVQMQGVAMLRILRSESDGMVRLEAARKERYDDMVIGADRIEAIYRVTAKLVISY